MSDGSHLFSTWRDVLGYRRDKKYQRQGVNEILEPSRVGARAKKEGRTALLASLPRGVLRYRHTEQSRNDVVEFLQSSFVRDFATQEAFPGYELATAEQLTCLERVSRIFPRCCLRDACKCRWIKPTTTCILDCLPSSITNCAPLQRHFSTLLRVLEPRLDLPTRF